MQSDLLDAISLLVVAANWQDGILSGLVACTYAFQDVTWRWLMLCPVRRDKNQQAVESTEFELNHIRNGNEKVIVRTSLPP